MRGFTEAGVARLSLDGTVLEDEVPPHAAAVIAMHTAIYQERPDTGCVLHTHSPFATAFAVANRPIKGWTEAFSILGPEDGVPVAAHGFGAGDFQHQVHAAGGAQDARGSARQPRHPLLSLLIVSLPCTPHSEDARKPGLC